MEGLARRLPSLRALYQQDRSARLRSDRGWSRSRIAHSGKLGVLGRLAIGGRASLADEGLREGAALAERFEERDADRVREVERAYGAEGRDPDHAIGVLLEERVRKPDALPSEDERIAGRERRVEVASLGHRAEEMEL